MRLVQVKFDTNLVQFSVCSSHFSSFYLKTLLTETENSRPVDLRESIVSLILKAQATTAADVILLYFIFLRK